MIKRFRNWRLPVRYRVPPRNDLIAFALMALAFGLMVGLAIAPGWGNAGSTGPVIALPADPPDTGPTDDSGAMVAADLQPPAGDEAPTSTGTADSPSDLTGDTPEVDTATEDLTEEPDPEVPTDNYAETPIEEPEEEQIDEEPDLTATVVGTDEAGYAVADSSGNLLYIHDSAPVSTEPKVGQQIGTGITPLGNGTFAQSGSLEDIGSNGSSKLSGTVSFVDQASGVITVSGRGVSLAVAAAEAMAKSSSPPVVGSLVTGTISFGRSEPNPAATEADQPEEPITPPAITVKEIAATGDPLTQIELTGDVTWDSAARTLAIGADSFGVLDREVPIAVPKRLPLNSIKAGRSYAASADIGEAGELTLAGFSANFSLEAASDAAQAFGTHAR